MLDTGQPGELPLMRELIALKRDRSLRDPSTVKSPVFGGAPVPRKSPLRGFVGRNSETGRASHGRGQNVGGQLPGSSTLRRAARKSALPLSKASLSLNESWDLGLQGTHPGDGRQQQEVFGGFGIKGSSMAGDESPHKHATDRNDDEFSLQNWTNPRWAPDEVGYDGRWDQSRDTDKRKTKSAEVPTTTGGVSSHSRDAFEFESKAGTKKSPPNKKNLTSKKDTISKQSSQILSPLILNSHDDNLYASGHPLSLFTLEGSLYDEQEHVNQGNKAAPHGAHGSIRAASQSASPFSMEHAGRSGLGEAVKKTWRSQDLLTTSSSTSQRTLSHGSLPGAWEASLDDELDVSELPQHGCGMPCHWSKSKKRSKTLLDIAGKSLSCGLPDSSRRKGWPCSKVQLEVQRVSVVECLSDGRNQSSNMEEREAVPFLTEPSAAVGDNDETSSTEGSGRLSSDRNKLGLDGQSAKKGGSRSVNSDLQVGNRLDHIISEGKELAVFVERPRSLSQKYRPKTFEELIGQNLVAHALSNAISRGKIAPVYLFQGSRGTGKTSAARIFSAALNCVTSGVKRPCGVCTECTALALGKTLHVQELDAASHNGIESVKALLQSTFSATSGSRYKVFIIDECHMLTNETWNALLKLLEEPPRNAVVILITTDPDKLPRTAVSRCQKFLFPKIKHSDTVIRLDTLVKLENLNVEPGALDLIASKSEGSLRDAETVLDQLSLLGQRITLATIHELVGSVSDDKLLSLLDLALCSDTVSTVQRARELIDSGVEPLDLMSQLATLITDILAGSYELMNRDQRRGFFSRHALSEAEMERLRTALRILSEAEKQLRAASKDRTTWLTAALLQFGPDRPIKFPASSTSASLTASPATRINHMSRKPNKSKASRSQKDTRKRFVPKRMVSNFERRSHGFVAKGISRSTKSSFEPRVHPTDQSSPHDASREFSTESESPFSGERNVSFKSSGNLGSIWLNVLEGCKSLPLRHLLQCHGKLLAVSFSTVAAVVHLEFGKPEHKHRAERYRKTIANSFKKVLGLAVEVKISLACLPPAGRGVLRSRMWPLASDQASVMQSTSKQYTSFDRTEGDELQNERSSLEVGSLRYWRSQSGVSFHNTSEQSNSTHSFPAISRFPNASVATTNRKSNDFSGFGGYTQFGYGAEAGMPEENILETAWIHEARRYSPLHAFNRGQPRGVRLSNKFGNETRHQEILSEDRKLSSSKLNKPTDGLHAQKYAHDSVFPSFKDGNSSQAYNFEEENLKLESRMKYGGLLCWKAPKIKQAKATKQCRRRKRGILIRLMPCVRFKSQ